MDVDNFLPFCLALRSECPKQRQQQARVRAFVLILKNLVNHRLDSLGHHFSGGSTFVWRRTLPDSSIPPSSLAAGLLEVVKTGKPILSLSDPVNLKRGNQGKELPPSAVPLLPPGWI